ncbi:hypothetical protein [Terricaulis sp.]|uniref:hypothetical protein n=1 Tax=Terricaulis sp. TaxID=2768686 RepID=UPI003784AFBA
MSAPWTLCIDFGTAFSKAAVAPSTAWNAFTPATVRPLMLGGPGQGNSFLLDSAVFVDDDRVLFGSAAVARAEALSVQKRLALRSFKTLLSVSDLERALNTSLPRSLDPHRAFTQRDLIVLYLAYLSAAIGRACAADQVLSRGVTFDSRYAAPAWRSGDAAGSHELIVRLFAEGDAIRAALGSEILAPQGLPLQTALKAVAAARSADTAAAQLGLIYEATAAAAYTSIGLNSDASHIIVVDMGAGTTDIAAMARAGAHVYELAEARVTLKQAGDFVDRVIVNIALEASPELKTPQRQAELWRMMFRSMRDIKETLFLDGRVGFRFEGRLITVSLKDLERDDDFKEFIANLERAYEHGLAAVRDHAKREKARDLMAVAVGGGAFAPFIQKLIRRKPPNAGRIKVQPRPATPDWAHAPEFGGNLAPVFPQLAIAIGGALAPESMLALRAGASRPANVQTGNPPARD